MRTLTAVALSLALVLSAPSAGAASQRTPSQKSPKWDEVQKLVNEQKFEAAATVVEGIQKDAVARKDSAEWAYALIKQVQLRSALHGYETSVRFLKDQPWPQEFLPHATLDLFYAHALVQYLDAYSWEIRKREKVDSKGEVDLKAWTADQIFAAALTGYQDVWKNRAELSKEPVSRLAEYVYANNYPMEIRGTLRDAVTYLAAELLQNRAYWTPTESNELFKLDLKALLADGDPTASKMRLDDTAMHPLLRAVAALGDLEAFHARQGHREAALEARLQRDRILAEAFTADDERALIRQDLETRLAALKDAPWWAMGMAELADMVRNQTGDLVRARSLAQQGAKAFPKAPGGQRCASIVEEIERPDYRLTSMSVDAPDRRSVQLEHKNLGALYLRAYPFDLLRRVETASNYNLLPDSNEVAQLVQSSKPAAEWTVQLPATPDFRMHRTFVTPPLKKKGAYFIVASAKPNFTAGDNRVLAAHLIVSDVVLLPRQVPNGGVEVNVVSGESGAPLPGVELMLYQYDWSDRHHHAVSTLKTDAKGEARFPFERSRNGSNYFLVARRGEDLALDPSYLSFWETGTPGLTTSALIYTDRSIYRPQQKVFFKVIAYAGHADAADWKTTPDTDLLMTLQDGNYQQVAQLKLKTNAFGSASGEFVLPAGRALGVWRLTCSRGAGAAIRVEEYKRPTFEVSLQKPEAPLRLNKPAALKGQARYYFGLPVTNGSVRWRVVRTPVFPYWWFWYGWAAPVQSQQIATGTSALKEDGTFELKFTPEADEKLAARSKEISYSYAVSADLTDEGGETRSDAHTYRVGFAAVEASLSMDEAFAREGEKPHLTLRRTNLDGDPRAGSGTWKLFALKQPARAPLPAELPAAESAEAGTSNVHTPGDALRPRWQTDFSTDALLATWTDGDARGSGTAAAGTSGTAELELPALPAGAYRLRYSTTDEFGTPVETNRTFVVAAPKLSLAVPLEVAVRNSTVTVGGTAELLVHSGLVNQPLVVDIFRGAKLLERRRLTSGGPSILSIPVKEADRGGLGVAVWGVRDHQYFSRTAYVTVPWDNKELKVAFATFRDRLKPGGRETFKVTVKSKTGDSAIAAGEVLAYMYDRTLDSFAPHSPPSPLSLFPTRYGAQAPTASLGSSDGAWLFGTDFRSPRGAPYFQGDRLQFYDSYGIGGLGVRGYGPGGGGRYRMSAKKMQNFGAYDEAEGAPARREMADEPKPAPAAPAPAEKAEDKAKDTRQAASANALGGLQKSAEPKAPEVRQNFAETAFWMPHLLLGQDGTASMEFTVPDSVTSWNVWVHAVTNDLRSGSAMKEAKSVKDLMVRPYVPRFFREGDEAELKVVVNNASDRELAGKLNLELIDPESGKSLAKEFGIQEGPRSFSAKPGGGTNLTFPLKTPKRVGLIAFRVTATAGDLSDGELRPLPVLPSRMHLTQSKFVTLRDKASRTMTFDDLAKNDDPTLVNEQMVVTVDAQLLYTVLKALPYLAEYPYECSEQTLNRFLSAGIVSSLYKDFPAIAKMGKQMSSRSTPVEKWDLADPNRRMALEETPWLNEANGDDFSERSIRLLDPAVATAQRISSLEKLRRMQTASGGFPWFPGGPPSPYITLYLMHGFARAAEFGVDVPKDMVQRGWQYLANEFRTDWARRMMREDCCWEFLTFMNYVASSYPDASWVGDAFTPEERKQVLDFSFRHWKQHAPMLKAYLALTLKRMNRLADGKLVFASVMDSAKTAPDQGTFWAPEDRSWLWYNDTIETHAFALRTLTELEPQNPKRDGLVLWLLLNKKLNHWKSTRATAEVLYSLVHYMKADGSLGVREAATVSAGPEKASFTFEPDTFTGKGRLVIPAEKVSAQTATVKVEKETKGFMFASATWSFSTDKLPAADRGDFFQVSRRYFKRVNDGKQWVLQPLAEGAAISPGDEVEVQMSLRSKHEAEYVHLRDPRPAGLEPESPTSRYKWDLGIGWYEEIRDSGTNFFFERLPVGEYTFKYRVRANMAGTFRIGPATVQSMYAPEFNAYSSGFVMKIANGGK